MYELLQDYLEAEEEENHIDPPLNLRSFLDKFKEIPLANLTCNTIYNQHANILSEFKRKENRESLLFINNKDIDEDSLKSIKNVINVHLGYKINYLNLVNDPTRLLEQVLVLKTVSLKQNFKKRFHSNIY